MKRICIDTGFLIALYDGKKDEELHLRAEKYFKTYFRDFLQSQLLVPWPVLYESVSTRMAKDWRRIQALNRDWDYLKEKGRLELINDCEFRDEAIKDCFKETERSDHYFALSLVDRVIHKVLSNVNIDIFITFDPGHFDKICEVAHIEIVN